MRRMLLVVLLVMGPAEAGRYVSPAEDGRDAVSAVAAQTPAPPQEGFVPVDDTDMQNQEQLPAAPLVAAAYGVAWAAVLIYVWFLWRRLAAVDRELTAMTRRLESGARR